MKKHVFIRAIAAVVLVAAPAFGNDTGPGAVSEEHPWFVGSSLFMLYNYVPDERPPNYLQLDFGYHLSPKDVLYAEAITWTYWEPMGSYGSSDEFYPGSVTAYGAGLAYQRFVWRRLYGAVQATTFHTVYYDRDHKAIQSGFQLYLQAGLGYSIDFAGDRFFVQPAAYVKYWPVNTNVPDDFTAIDKGAPAYIFEPSLNFGYRF